MTKCKKHIFNCAVTMCEMPLVEFGVTFENFSEKFPEYIPEFKGLFKNANPGLWNSYMRFRQNFEHRISPEQWRQFDSECVNSKSIPSNVKIDVFIKPNMPTENCFKFTRNVESFKQIINTTDILNKMSVDGEYRNRILDSIKVDKTVEIIILQQYLIASGDLNIMPRLFKNIQNVLIQKPGNKTANEQLVWRHLFLENWEYYSMHGKCHFNVLDWILSHKQCSVHKNKTWANLVVSEYFMSYSMFSQTMPSKIHLIKCLKKLKLEENSGIFKSFIGNCIITTKYSDYTKPRFLGRMSSDITISNIGKKLKSQQPIYVNMQFIQNFDYLNPAFRPEILLNMMKNTGAVMEMSAVVKMLIIAYEQIYDGIERDLSEYNDDKKNDTILNKATTDVFLKINYLISFVKNNRKMFTDEVIDYIYSLIEKRIKTTVNL